ncbi:MAG: PaaI family thioesterase [Desulfotomaculales bacterium]
MPDDKNAFLTGTGPLDRTLLTDRNPFPRSLGIRLERVAPGYAEARMVVREDMLNFLGVTHGGVVFALADTVFGAASNAYGGTALAVHADISYIRATTAGTVLVARAVEESRGGRVAHFRVTVEDGEGNLVALFLGVAYLKNPPPTGS